MVIRVDSPLRSLVERYLRDEMTFLDFEHQFVVASWDVEKRGDPDLAEMTGAIVCLLIDIRDRRMTEDELRAALWREIATGLHGETLSSVTVSGSSATEMSDEYESATTTTQNVGRPLAAAPS